MEEKILGHLSSKIEERRRELVEFLGDGSCKDYVHYKEVCGVIRGLLTAQSHINDLVRNFKEYDDDN